MSGADKTRQQKSLTKSHQQRFIPGSPLTKKAFAHALSSVRSVFGERPPVPGREADKGAASATSDDGVTTKGNGVMGHPIGCRVVTSANSTTTTTSTSTTAVRGSANNYDDKNQQHIIAGNLKVVNPEPRPQAEGSPSTTFESNDSWEQQPPTDSFDQRPLPLKAADIISTAEKMAPSPKAVSESGASSTGGRGFEPEGSADVTPPFSESNSNNSTPAYLRWAENLSNLLSDPDGVELYKNYLKTENVEDLLDFWFACQGLKKLACDQMDKIYQLVKVINKKFIRSKAVPIAEETRKAIQEKIQTKQGVDQEIFDRAQQEVEDRMTRTTYRNFLTSDSYLNYIQHMQTGGSDFSAKCSGTHSTASSISGRAGFGPTADGSGHFSAAPGHDSGTPISTRQSRHVTGGYHQPQHPAAAQARLHTDNTSDSTSGISETSSGQHQAAQHNKAGQQLAAHAHNVPPNNTVNTTSGSMDESELSLHTASQLVNSLSAQLPTLHENSELDLTEEGLPLNSRDNFLSSSLLGLSSSGLTGGGPPKAGRRLGLSAYGGGSSSLVKPEAQAGLYLQPSGTGGGGRVSHSYHAYNSAYNPVSRQDSELQSLSSDAQTTDDNMSSFTESSSHYSYRLQQNRKYVKRQQKRMQEQSRHNRESAQAGHSQSTAFIPRTARVPPEAMHQLPPDEFAAILIQKLEKVKKAQDLQEKLDKKLSEDTTGSVVSQDSNRSLAEMLREKLLVNEESDQSILDDHVSRIWTDKTPIRSPGDPIGRPRSPGHRRGGKHGLAQVTHHRTLPGRGHRGAQTRRLQPGQQQVYHQDLAYYEIDRPGLLAVGAPGSNQGAPVQGNNNSRVMEWMRDVERQQQLVNPQLYPQRSQQPLPGMMPPTSMGQPPVSIGPGGGKPVLGGAGVDRNQSQSQERLMSTSWTAGGGQMPAAGYPVQGNNTLQQLEEAKRRLGGGGHHQQAGPGFQQPQQFNMLPPSANASAMGGSASNNSTLRRPGSGGQQGQQLPPQDCTVAVYNFSHEKDPMPYRVRIPTKAVTLKAVKDLLPKKGAFRFYFKTEVDGEVCYEEETEDANPVPLWEGKVLVQCRLMD